MSRTTPRPEGQGASNRTEQFRTSWGPRHVESTCRGERKMPRNRQESAPLAWRPKQPWPDAVLPSSGETVLRVGDLELDLVARTVSRGGRNIALLPREFQVLEYWFA